MDAQAITSLQPRKKLSWEHEPGWAKIEKASKVRKKNRQELGRAQIKSPNDAFFLKGSARGEGEGTVLGDNGVLKSEKRKLEEAQRSFEKA